MDKVASDEPLYEAISKLDGFVNESESSKRVNLKQCIFVLIASVFCGLATFSTLNSSKKLFTLDQLHLTAICVVVVVLLGLIAAFFHHARCTVSLMLPVLFSGLGRSLIRSIIVTLIVSGPLQNIGDNAVLLAKSIECSAELTIEQANETTQATIAALHEQMESVSRATRSINENSKKVEAFADKEMVKVLESEDKDGHLSPDRMLKRGARQCHLNTDGPRRKCEVGINVDLEKCEQIKTSDDGCQNYNKQNLADDNFKLTEGIKKTVSKFGEQYNEPKYNLSSENKIEINNTLITSGFKVLMSELNSVGGYISTFMNLVSLVLLSLVLVGAIQHQIKYLTELSYLNNVVTSQLLKLDASVPLEHRTFPLPVYMKTFVRDGNQKCLSRDELKLAMIATLKHLIFSLLFLLMVFVDAQVYGTMEDISDTGYIVYEVYIKTGVLMHSEGGKWTRGIVDGIPNVNTLNHISFTQDNNNCLPDGSPPDKDKILCICVFIVLIVLLNFFQIYSQRAIRRICAWFYPEREGKRVQFLFRFLKQRRMDCFQILVEDKKGCPPTPSLLKKWFPRWFKSTCVVCGDSPIQTSCLFCFGHGYDIQFCLECWTDTESKCPFCRATQKLAGSPGVPESDSESDSDWENEARGFMSSAYQIIETEDEEGSWSDVKTDSSYSETYRKIMQSYADSSSDDDYGIMNLFQRTHASSNNPHTRRQSGSFPSNSQLSSAGSLRNSSSLSESFGISNDSLLRSKSGTGRSLGTSSSQASNLTNISSLSSQPSSIRTSVTPSSSFPSMRINDNALPYSSSRSSQGFRRNNKLSNTSQMRSVSTAGRVESQPDGALQMGNFENNSVGTMNRSVSAPLTRSDLVADGPQQQNEPDDTALVADGVAVVSVTSQGSFKTIKTDSSAGVDLGDS